ncbi:hypothetical protein BBW68_14915 [Candidatus Erwinia dacicola]|uniref:Major facilitator superfamily (MFS) profile domain-containing protein n=2 Tax=Candidatus Erwinia dacicola TaxID=252393 RepID=A0A1E7YVG5_9GAMM|nr:hypothetical protein BBW68_14915 [Candidatus Erwinia dacicola]
MRHWVLTSIYLRCRGYRRRTGNARDHHSDHYLLVMELGQIIAGPLVDNLGRKSIALIGRLLYIGGGMLAAVS